MFNLHTKYLCYAIYIKVLFIQTLQIIIIFLSTLEVENMGSIFFLQGISTSCLWSSHPPPPFYLGSKQKVFGLFCSIARWANHKNGNSWEPRAELLKNVNQVFRKRLFFPQKINSTSVKSCCGHSKVYSKISIATVFDFTLASSVSMVRVLFYFLFE